MTLKLPFYKQETTFSCVPACLKMVLSSLGMRYTEEELRELCDCTIFETNALQAVEAVRQLGLKNTVKSTLELSDLESLLREEIFPILYVNLLPIDGVQCSHSVVVTGISDEGIFVIDPLQGERVLPLTTFISAWGMMNNLAIVIR
jgi:ABC-type bacteriocin/lantibiotic exporter with double-glycine peptidase domain